jgi:hypothetical protein
LTENGSDAHGEGVAVTNEDLERKRRVQMVIENERRRYQPPSVLKRFDFCKPECVMSVIERNNIESMLENGYYLEQKSPLFDEQQKTEPKWAIAKRDYAIAMKIAEANPD